MKLLFSLLIIYIATTTTACASEDIVVTDDLENGNLIFYNGTFLTMKEEGSKIKNDSAALMIANGKIVGFESLKDAIIDANDPKYGGGFKYVDLNHKTLMPGFIEPHAHLMLTANGEAVTNLMPCLPDKYQAIYEKDYPETKKCKNFINEALGKLADEQKLVNGWYIGNGLDPSRMLLDDQKSSKETWININRQFLEQPAHFIQHFNSVTQTFDTNLKKKEEGGKYPFDKEAPLFILDQSGHLAYVNEIAFQKAGICSFSSEEVLDKDDKVICIGTKVQMNKSLELAQKEYKFKDGAWGITCEKDRDVCYFSGLLNEESAYQPFIKAIGTPSVRSILKHARQNDLALGVEKRMTELMQIFSRQGVTTFVEGGGSSEEMIKAYKNMVKANTMAARLRILYAWDIKNTAPEKIPFDSDEFKGFLSAEGIKLWADGSTQGCSADLITDYSNLGLCARARS
jgi:predicted amidohydrolase YtcJ